ncbi:MAG: glycosyltransferase [Alphaproteobacteria bacterium]
MHALVVSPIPTDPDNQGNAARITRFCELLQCYGYQVHFLYYGLEGLTNEAAHRMRLRWDFFHFVQPVSPKTPSAPDGYLIDDVYGQELATAIDALEKMWHYDLAVINYVWMSAACLSLDQATFKIIDTHDVFGERQYLLQRQKIPPAWFFTSAAQESRGLDRADLIIAIQPEEARILRCRTTRPVIVIGHILPPNFRPLGPGSDSGPLQAGYLASGNPSNRLSLAKLVHVVSENPRLLDKWNFLIAGAIGEYVPSHQRGFSTISYVDSLTAFYGSIDVVINPNISGSGLKIKSIEALSFGLPLVSTASGMAGISTNEPAHLCGTLQEMIDRLLELTDMTARYRLAQASRSVFLRYTREQENAFRRLLLSRMVGSH